MGIFSKIWGIFRRTKTEDNVPAVPETPQAQMPAREITAESATTENVKARMDLVLTQMDSLRVQYQAISERVANIERMVKELYDMAKHP